jgi:hypothetical protein
VAALRAVVYLFFIYIEIWNMYLCGMNYSFCMRDVKKNESFVESKLMETLWHGLSVKSQPGRLSGT